MILLKNYLNLFSEFILEDSDLIEKEELYPYHNACRIIAEGVWRHTWDTKLNKYTLNPSEFKKRDLRILFASRFFLFDKKLC